MNAIDQLFSGARTSASGLLAERARIDVIAENIANARTTSTPDGGPYTRQVVAFEPLVQRERDGSFSYHGVRASKALRDERSPFQRIKDPSHPDADAEGFVTYPNVDAVLEMTDLITAMRAYEANLTMQDGFYRLAERALQMAAR